MVARVGKSVRNRARRRESLALVFRRALFLPVLPIRESKNYEANRLPKQRQTLSLVSRTMAQSVCALVNLIYFLHVLRRDFLKGLGHTIVALNNVQ